MTQSTIDDIPDAEPIPHKLPFWKVVLRVFTSLVRLGIEIFLLVCACTPGIPGNGSKVGIVLYSCYVPLWVSAYACLLARNSQSETSFSPSLDRRSSPYMQPFHESQLPAMDSYYFIFSTWSLSGRIV